MSNLKKLSIPIHSLADSIPIATRRSAAHGTSVGDPNRPGASPGQNMWGGQTWRARSASL